uniref:NUDIX domain-containing protein n=1 Tax=Bergeyella zoohelcum TaxID=1015 RepID=UPI003735EBB5
NFWEHELDHVFIGSYEGEFQLNPEEVSEIRYITLDDLLQEVSSHPDDFTEWFKIILSEYMSHIKIN